MTQLLENENTFKELITIGDKLIAHCFCMYHPANQQLQIVDLFATMQCSLLAPMLDEVLRFADRCSANEVVAYCGPEPFNPGKSWTLAEEMQFYKDHGFEHISDICGVTPCMVKKLHNGGELNHDNEHSIIQD